MTHIHVPAHRHSLEGHQCGVDNAPRGFFQAAQSAVFADDKGIPIAFYAPGHGRVPLPSGRSVNMELRGDFMHGDPITLTLAMDAPKPSP